MSMPYRMPGGDNSPAVLGWKISGKGSNMLAETMDAVAPSDVTNRKKRKAKHLINWRHSVVAASAAAASAEAPAQPPSATYDSEPAAAIALHDRILRKRLQVESFAIVLNAIAVASAGAVPLTIVDFGAAAGSLVLPLAWRFPQFQFVAVDIRQFSLNLLEEKARQAGLQNVSTVCCMIEQYTGPLDIVLALHACGNATDFSLLQATTRAQAFIVSPCCIGKLKFSASGEGNSLGAVRRDWQYDKVNATAAGESHSSGQSTGSCEASSPPSGAFCAAASSRDASNCAVVINSSPAQSSCGGVMPSTISHPRSAWLAAHVSTEMFVKMAGVADTSESEMASIISGDDDYDQTARPQAAAAAAADAVATVGSGAASAAESSTSGLTEQTRAAHRVPLAMPRACKMRVEEDRAHAARESGFDCWNLLLRRPEAQVPNKQDMIVGVRSTGALADSLRAAMRPIEETVSLP